ncbi:MAG: cupin domain-containing protein [Gammaproteobacteria bacterium]|nr:cupin domain-containing protein [Gammaproteobacteria bacterium]NIM73512.1 cupin domain-containing protein [Gammaproteobacteria bacterium]NIN39921.1 cupin domain-containing protein [Gammaproteobacteria bacterium]NIO25321.1 cupin domain-containing protein [Gammaproteobacteria bacterium]NIO65948.1 cupin domain-containing protein [Gammaproteobacteria bacterium]
MNRDQFEQRMQEKGYGNAEVKTYPPNTDGPMHTHDVSVMALVLSGEITLALEESSTTYAVGEWCELAAGTLHTERTGASGASILLAYK